MATRNGFFTSSTHVDALSYKPAAMSRNTGIHRPTQQLQDDDLDSIFKGGVLVKTYEGTSQYMQQGFSACGLASFNAVRYVMGKEQEGVRQEVLLREMMSYEAIQNVTSICASWTSRAHLEIEEIYNLPIFSEFLQLASVKYGRPSVEWFAHCFRNLEALAKNGSNAVIFARAPELLCVLRIDMSGYEDLSDVWVVLDSHSSSPHHGDGAAFSFFGTMRGAAEYVAELLQVDSNVPISRMPQQTQLLSQCSAYIVTQKSIHVLDPDADSTLHDASIAILGVKSQLADLQINFSNLQNSHRELAERSQRVEGSNSKLNRELADTRESMNMLRQHREAQALQEQSWMNSRRKDKGKERERHSYYPESNHGLQSNSAGGDGSFVGKATKAVTAVADYFLAAPPPDVVDDANHTHSHPSKSTPHQSGYQSHHNIRDSDHHSRSKSTKKDKPLKSDREVAARIQVLQDEEYALQLQQDILAQERQDAEYAASLQRDFDNERIRLLDDETMMRNYGRQETFDCCICMETHPEDSVAKVEPCGHKFCRPCIQSYVSSKIRENVFPIVCPLCATGKSKNKGAITGDFIEIIGVSEEDYIKYSQLALTQFSILLECRKCGKSVNVDKDDLRAASIITCPVPGCRGMWCRECSQFVDDADGANHSCDGTKELDRLLMQKGWRRCPGCTTPVEKTAGCDHMTCGVRTCGTHFSWSTGRRM